jgi:SUN domain-containing protein 1/2
MASAASVGTRRSARLSSVARSVGSQSVATETAGASGTPSRRRGPLAKVKARQSTAYGASGRLGDAEELTVATTGFVQAFQSQRGAAVSRVDEENVMSGGLNGAAGQHSPTPDQDAATPSSQAYESEDPPSSDEEESTSGAHTTKSFGMMREAGMLRPPPSLPRPRPMPSSSRKSPAKSPAFQPMSLQALNEQRARHQEQSEQRARLLERASQRAPIPQAPVAPPVVAPPRNPSPRRESVVDDVVNPKSGWKRYLLLGLIPMIMMIMYMLAGGPGIKTQLASGLHSMGEWLSPPASEANQARLRDLATKNQLSLKDVQDGLSAIHKELPAEFAAYPNQDGSWTMHEEFWKALVSRLQTDGPSPDWDAFLEKNQKNVEKMYQEGLTWQQGQGTVVLKNELFAAMNSSWSKLSADVDKKVDELTKHLAAEAGKIAEKEAKKVTIQQGRLHSLALTNLLASMDLYLRKVNYFSTGLGAKIITGLTSATYVDNPAVLARLYRRVMFLPERRPPTAALTSWEEPGDCWCSAPDEAKKGKTQLAVQLNTPIYPTQITIEHIPKTMIPQENISSAPRYVEIWAQTRHPIVPRLGQEDLQCEDGPPGWVCLGLVTYDIRGADHVQTFLLDAQTTQPVDQVMVRVNQNWGADHTCIYRVRLHGRDSLPKHEYNDFDY